MQGHIHAPAFIALSVSEPLQRVEVFLILSVLGPVNHLGFIGDVGHPLLGEGCPDNIPSQILHGLFVAGLNSGAAMNIEAGMTPRHDELDHFMCDFAFPQEHLEDLVLKELLQSLRVECRGYLEVLCAPPRCACVADGSNRVTTTPTIFTLFINLPLAPCCGTMEDRHSHPNPHTYWPPRLLSYPQETERK
jgi:hypothetical protein